jgi:hypothetical protein
MAEFDPELDQAEKLIPKVYTGEDTMRRAYQFVKDQLDKNWADHQSRQSKWAEWDNCYRLIDANVTTEYLQCKVVDPEPQVEVETLKSNIVEAFLAQDPPFKYKPGDETDEDQAEIMTSYTADNLRRIVIRDKFERSIHQLLVMGTCIVKTPWRKESEKRLIRVRSMQLDKDGLPKVGKDGKPLYKTTEKKTDIPKMDDIDWEYVSLYDFYPCGRGNSIQDLDGCAQKFIRTFDDLKANERKTESVDGEEVTTGIYYNLDGIHLSSSKLDIVEYWGQIPKHVITGSDDDKYRNFEGVITCIMDMKNYSDEYTKRQHAEKTGEIYSPTETSSAERAIRCQENPFWSGERPYLSCGYTPVDDEFYGIGMIEPILEKWHELNTTIRQLSDNKTLQLRMPMIEDATANIQRANSLIANPRIKADDINGIKPLPLSDFSRNGWQMVGAIKDDMRRASGALESIQGTPMNSSTSATEFAGIAQQAGVRLKNRIKYIDEKLFKPFLNRCYEYNMQFAEAERVVRVLGKKGTKLVRVGPEGIWGNFDIITQGPTEIENNAMMANKLTNFIAIAAKIPGVDLPNLVKKVWIKMGFPESEADEIVPTPGLRDQTLDIENENMALSMGQPVNRKPQDDDFQHYAGHQQEWLRLRDGGQSTDQSREAFLRHMAQHNVYMSQKDETIMDPQAQLNELAQNGGIPVQGTNGGPPQGPNPMMEMSNG